MCVCVCVPLDWIDKLFINHVTTSAPGENKDNVDVY